MRATILIAISLLLSMLLVACGDGRGDRLGEPLDDVGEAAPQLADAPQPLSILIFGGTAGVGLQTVELALQRGHTVTSIARRPERMTIEHERLQNIKGDITLPDTYEHLFASQNVIISAIGLGPTRDEVTVYSQGMLAVLASMAQHDNQRVITITGIGSGNSQGHGGFFYDVILNPLLLKTDYEDKTRQEEILADSVLDWTIVRPGFLTDDSAKTSYRVLRDLEGVTAGDIARADVAHFLVAISEDDTYIRETVLLTN